MIRTLSRCYALFNLAILISGSVFAQKEFFRSGQTFTKEQLASFYSSVTIGENDLFFLANDYKLYAYDLKTQVLKWTTELSYKTRRSCYVSGNNLFAPYYQEKHEWEAMFDRTNGKHIRTLPIAPLATKPFIKNNILYGTAIYEGGNMLAYDIKQDSILWWQFLAHGVSTQPYFFDGFIQANAESDNWVRLNYEGKQMDTTCKVKADIFVKDISCIREFRALAHDGAELDEAFSEKIFGEREAISPDNTVFGKNYTFILYEDQLAIIGKKKKLLKKIDLNELLAEKEGFDPVGLSMILEAGEENVQFISGDLLVRYNFKKGAIDSILDLSEWQPSQVVPDGTNIWLISKKDGLLYGLSTLL